MDSPRGLEATRSGRRQKYVIAAAIVLLGLIGLWLSPYVFLYFALYSSTETVVQSRAPDGGLTLSVVERSFPDCCCYYIKARRAWRLGSTTLGKGICQDWTLPAMLPFDASSQRFAWFGERDMVAIAAGRARRQYKGLPPVLYTRLFRYDEAGNIREISTENLRADPSDSPPGPLMVGEGPADNSGEYAWRDRRIRALLGLNTPASPDAASTPDAAGTPPPTVTPDGARP